MKVAIRTAKAFEPLLQPARYKGAHGGRASGKSHFFGDLGVEDCLRWPGDAGEGLRMVCVREVQKSLLQSAKRLLEDKLHEHGLGEGQGFKVFKDSIQTPGDGIITFQGMQDHNAESIKSLEGFHRAWVEEAQTLSERSLGLLRPTIRWEDKTRDLESELWFSWNPRRKSDPVDVMLRQGKLPTGAKVVQANWRDNPWWSDVMERERLDCLNNEPEQYQHIWEGDYISIGAGAYYAPQLAEARQQGRIGEVARDPLHRFRAFVDIGGTGARSDAFSMWIAQFTGMSIRVLDYYEAQGQEIGEHLHWMRERGYTPENTGIWLPHDGATNDRVYNVSYQSAFEDAGFAVEVIANQGRGAASARISRTRRLFPNIHINEATCAAGLEALGWYHEKKDELRGIGLGPEHDWCLAAGTQVLTSGGWRNIEDISKHDQVLTPYGARNILRSGIVRMTSEWVIVKGVYCTPEHRFFTSRGLVEAGELLPQDRFWTQGDLGLTILAFLSAMLRLGLKAAITLATQEGRPRSGGRCSYIGWCMKLCMAKYRKGMRSIISMMIHSTITPKTLRQCRVSSTAVSINQNHDIHAHAGFAAPSLAATKNSGRGAAQSVSVPIMQESKEKDAPAYNITVDRDECYFIRGNDGRAYLVSNSSHGADAFGLMCVAWEEPRSTRMPNVIRSR